MFEDAMGRGRKQSLLGRWLPVACALGLSTLVLPACGGGGSSDGGTGGSLEDPVIPLVGSTGQYSQTPEQANQSKGIAKPPVMPLNANGSNQYFRLEVPYVVRGSDIYSAEAIFAPFSQLIGNLTVTDELGNHVLGIAMVNGVDAFGRYRGSEVGFPHDLTAGGQDKNLGTGVILYVADDGDGSLATIAALGGTTTDSDLQPDTTDITQIRIALDTLNNRTVSAFYTITVGDGTVGDAVGPKVISVTATTPDPTDPLNPARCATLSSFIVQFSEPCVPTTVGKSATLDGTPYLGNLPLLPTPPLPPQPPLPSTYITTQLNAAASPLFLPCDIRPLNSNNLATYIVTPLIDLPANRTIQVTEVDANANQDLSTGTPVGAMDLSGNLHSPGAPISGPFNVGPGRVPVNAPVSPEVFYWLPISGDGIGAVDLNGYGFTTNTPGKYDNTYLDPNTGTLAYDPQKSADLYAHAVLAVKGLANTQNAFGIFGIGNRFAFPVGLGSFRYGPPLTPGTPAFTIGSSVWIGNGPSDSGNPGTPIPGINEMSSGFETMVRDAEGDVILTGRNFGTVGAVADLCMGEFLDAGIFDTQSIFNSNGNRATLFFGVVPLPPRNLITDPPSPNPPPLRYWVGLQPVDILIDQNNPLGMARLIEGDEVWSGTTRSYSFALPSPVDPLSYDVDIAPSVSGFENGPNPQSGTANKAFTARQQVGNYLYAVDTEASALQVLNSNTFQLITSIDLPTPAGVAVMPNNRYVFTSNAGDDSMSVIGSDPTQPDFHKEIAHIDVGRGPRAIACEPDGEDVFVANELDNTISIVELATLTVRKTLDALIEGPREIVVAPRQGAFGWAAGVYFAYIANFTGNSVVVYESGPDGPQGIGCNNVLGALPTQGTDFEVFEPRALCYVPYPNSEGLYAGGVYVGHRDSIGTGLLSQIMFTHQALFGPLPCVLPPGRFFIPPGFNVRIFEITGQWGDNAGSALIGTKPSSIVLTDFRYESYALLRPAGVPSQEGRGTPGFGARGTRHPIVFPPPGDARNPNTTVLEPDRMYVSFEDVDRIQIFDPIRVGVAIGELKEPTGIGVKKLVGYYNSQ